VNGELAQVIALITYGTPYLSGAEPEAPELFPSNSTFQYVSELAFKRGAVKSGLPGEGEALATSTRTWFAKLRDAGVKGLELALVQIQHELPQHIAVAFAGSGGWAIQASSGKETELWRAKWSIKDQHDPQKRVWAVEYRVVAGRPAQTGFPSVDEAAEQLEQALKDARTFAAKANLHSWGEWFDEAAKFLNQPAPVIPYHPDLLPPGFQILRPRQLLASACKAWVFGGMGSWNDLYFEDESLEKDYDPLTARLYQAVMDAFGAVTNSGVEESK
jgi:hypothetical protein